MSPAYVEKDSLLAVDVGSATTRAMLFDVVAGRYRFIAIGQSPSTAHAPFRDISEGVYQAIENLQKTTGRTFLDKERNIISTSQSDGSGADSFAASLSAGAALNIVIAGLLTDVSLASTVNLAESTYGRVVETLSLNDPRSSQEKIDAIIQARPDLILIAGGTDGGATRSLKDILEVIGLACYLIPQDRRPAVLFAGNQNMEADVREALGNLTSAIHISSNIRPSVDTEDLQPARKKLAHAVIGIRKNQLQGVAALDMRAGGNLLPSAFAEGRLLNFLSNLYGANKAVLSVNLGASATTISAGFGDQLSTSIYPHLGMGAGLADLQKYTSLENISRWLPLDIHPQNLIDYLYQKALYPTSIPATEDDLRIEQALAREVLQLALQQAHKKFDRNASKIRANLLPIFEVILAGGSVLTNTPTLGQSLLILLDAVQPIGISTIILDQNNLLPVLGAAASNNSLLPVQVLESGAFITLASAISPVSSARYGSKILRAQLNYDDGTENGIELKQGGFESLRLRIGQSARLTLQPLQRTDIGFGPGKQTSMRINGSALGIVLDGRERPLNLTTDSVRRRELMKKWLWTVGG